MSELRCARDLHVLLKKFEGREITISAVLEGLDYRTQGLIILILSIPFVLPMPIMGLSTIFGSVMIVAAIGIMLNRNPWLPKKLKNKVIPNETMQGIVKKTDWVSKRLGRVVRPRLLFFSKSAFWIRIHALMILIAALILALPSPPGGNVLPGAATMVLSLGLVEEDGLVLILGYILTALNVFLLALILIYGLDWFMNLLPKIF